jgi:hypothetical protein
MNTSAQPDPSTPRLGPADFHEGPEAAQRFKDLARRVLTAPKEADKKPKHPPKKKSGK